MAFVLPRAFLHAPQLVSPSADPLTWRYYAPWELTAIGTKVPSTDWYAVGNHEAAYRRNLFSPPPQLSHDDHTLPLYAAYRLDSPQYRLLPEASPVLQTATWQNLIAHLLIPPWERAYEYGLADMPLRLDHQGVVVTGDVPRLVILVARETISPPWTAHPLYEYVLGQGIAAPALPLPA